MRRIFDLADTDPTIFVVDDQPVNILLLVRTLEHAGYKNIVAIEDSREVLEEYKKNRPDLILLDLSMPRLDGFGVMEQLSRLEEPVPPPIIVLTAETAQEQIIKALEAGARDYVGKPFNRNELLMRMRNLLEAHLAHQFVFDQKETFEMLVNSRTEELRRTRAGVIARLSRAAEYRDDDTGQHIRRIGEISALMAARLGWSNHEVEEMRSASLMHDVGKIGIPDTILLKPGKLTPEERATMQTHTTIGGDILDGDDSSLMKLSKEIALTHHERWDGTGYPAGLIGDDIPESGRIVAVVDVFDALTSDRPYKSAWSTDDAYAFIVEQKGIHFDPRMVERFSEIFDEILRVYEELSDS